MDLLELFKIMQDPWNHNVTEEALIDWIYDLT